MNLETDTHMPISTASADNATRKRHLLMFLTEDWFFLSHFVERALAAKERGYDVSIIAKDNGDAEKIRALGLNFIPLGIRRRGLNPVFEIATLISLYRKMKQAKPDIIHNIALKPILLGSLAARLAGCRGIVNAPVGMGFLFSSSSTKARILRPLVRLLLKILLNPKGSKIIFENPDNLAALSAIGVVREKDSTVIYGAGVNIEEYVPAEEAPPPPVTVTLVCRMLWEKGVADFVEAARLLKSQGTAVRMWLVGDADEGSLASIPKQTLSEWHSEGAVEWLGKRSDIPDLLQQSHIACLPSFYGEGLPKSILEALASGLPVITTDTPGCRHAVADGENGLLVPPQDPKALASAIMQLVDDAPMRQRMGAAGRMRAETLFASDIVIEKTLAVYDAVVSSNRQV